MAKKCYTCFVDKNPRRKQEWLISKKESNVIVTNWNRRQIRAFGKENGMTKSGLVNYLINKTVEAGTIYA